MIYLKKRALFSVSDKNGILALAACLHRLDYELVSTGGTANLLRENNLPVTEVGTVTGFPECLDGRVKTLHPNIFAGLLAMGDNPAHQQTLADFNIAPIDIMVCNLYPFVETISKPGCSLAEAIENIDIGGPSMIRAAAKNYNTVAVVTDASQYNELIEKLENGGLDRDYRFRLAVKAFNHTAAYDAHVAAYLNKQTEDGFPEQLTLTFSKDTAMRYGENPHQQAAFYIHKKIQGIESAKFLHGKELSYNNIGDANGALAVIREFTDEPACAAIKHGSPCGVGTGRSVFEAYKKAYECDPVSIFGGIISFNREVDAETANEMNKLFLEVIIAPAYSADALRILTKKKNLRLLELPVNEPALSMPEYKSTGGGLLVQEIDNNDISEENHTVVTAVKPTEAQIKDMIFGMKVVKHVKSNAIVVVRDGQTLGIGGGQVSRVWAAEGAINHACTSLDGAVLASDAMFPFPDVVELAAKAGIKAIIQPGGSKNDNLSVEMCDQHGITMVLTGVRHFKH
jgi:phosphoribosylaminoimidazolecarboxamide formyltransferase/IMP cyclohydrolase